MLHHLKHIFFLSPLLLMLACTPQPAEEVAIPSTILSEDQMVAVLSDMTLAEAASGVNVANVKIEKFDSAYAFNPLKEHGISQAQLDSSIAFYSQHPVKMKAIYTRMLENFSKMQTERKK